MTFFMSSPSSLSRSFTPVHFCIHLSKVRINVGSIIAWRNQYEGRKDVQEGKGKCRQHCFLLKIANPLWELRCMVMVMHFFPFCAIDICDPLASKAWWIKCCLTPTQQINEIYSMYSYQTLNVVPTLVCVFLC